MSKNLDLQEFVLEDIPISCTWIVVGPPTSGKTTFIKNLIAYNAHKYPVAKAFVGTQDAYKYFNRASHELYNHKTFDENAVKNYVLRQSLVEDLNGKGDASNNAILLFDDMSSDTSIYKKKVMRGLFKNGSQHYNSLTIFGTQYCQDFGPDIRKSVSYVAIFSDPDVNEREKLYRNFGGLAGTKDDFYKLMDEVCFDHKCLIFKKRTQSKNIEDNVFWYRTDPEVGVNPESGRKIPLRIGCPEYIQNARDRYDKNYVEVHDDLVDD